MVADDWVPIIPHSILQDNGAISEGEHPLVEKMERLVAANLDNEQFGVGQLAEQLGISRSHLHRKLKKIRGKSISRFIREYRLEEARKMLVEKDFTASEASHSVGFGSPTYFNKCFTEYFGYSPGKARMKMRQEYEEKTSPKFSKIQKLVWAGLLVVIVLVGFLTYSGNKKEAEIPLTVPREKSIFVMHIENLSNDENNALISTLGKEKKNSAVLMGSLQRLKDNLRLEFSMIDLATGNQLWAEKFDRKVEDLLEIQNEVANKVAQNLEVIISKRDKSKLDSQTSYRAEAYELYLQGWYQYNALSRENNQKAVYYFNEAIKKDSTLALAYMGLATYYAGEASVSVSNLGAKQAFELSRKNLEKAFSLNPNVRYANTNMGFVACFSEWDFAKADKHYSLAIQDNEPLAYYLYRDFLQFEHRHEEALAVAQKLQSEFPFYIGASLAIPYYYNGKIEEGKKYVEAYLKDNPKDHMGLDNIGFFYLNIGEYDRAIGLFENVINNGNFRFPRMLGWMGAAYAKKGEMVKARELLDELEVLKSKTDAGSPAWFAAIVHCALGEKKEALKWLTTAIDDREMEVPWLVGEPQLYPLHGLPEFDALVKRVGFREHAYPVELP